MRLGGHSQTGHQEGTRAAPTLLASSFSGTTVPLAWANFSFLSSHCLPLCVSRSCKNRRPQAPPRAGGINISDAFLISCDSTPAGTLQPGGLRVHLGILQKGRRKHQPPSAIPRARLPWLLQPLCFLKPVSTHLRCQCAWLRDKGSIIQQAQCSPGTGKARRHLFLSSFYFAKHGLSVQRTEPHSFPAEHKGEICSSAGSWCSCLQPEGFKRAGCSRIQRESPASYQGGSLCHSDTALAHYAPWALSHPFRSLAFICK